MAGLVLQSGGISETPMDGVGSGGFHHTVHGKCDQEQTAIAVFTTKVLVVAPTGILTANSVRVYFDREMKYNDDLLDQTNYTISPSADSINVTVLSVVAENSTNPTYVDLTTTEFTGGKIYELLVDGPIGLDDEAPMDNTQDAIEMLGIGDRPTIEHVVATSKNSFEITFSEGMFENGTIINEDNYVFTPTLAVHSVQYFVDKVVLITDDQTPGVLYSLAINATGGP